MCGSHSCVVLSALPADKERGKVRRFSLKEGKNVVIVKLSDDSGILFLIAMGFCKNYKNRKRFLVDLL